MPVSPEKLMCSIVEREYESTVNTIELALNLPVLALRTLKGNVKRFEAIVLAFVERELIIIEELILQFVEINKLDNFDRTDRTNFCRAAYACDAFIRSAFPSNGDDPTWVQSIPKSVRDTLRIREGDSAYDIFERYVCKLSLRAILNGFIDEQIANLQRRLDRLLNKLGINKIDQWIQQYLDAIAPFLQTLQELDKYAQCAFETCNFVETALNKQESVSRKLLVSRQARGWSVVVDDKINETIQKERELRLKIERLKVQLARPKFGSDGVSPEDLMKF